MAACQRLLSPVVMKIGSTPMWGLSARGGMRCWAQAGRVGRATATADSRRGRMVSPQTARNATGTTSGSA